MPLCPFCESGELNSFVAREKIAYNGKQLQVDGVALSRCDACGEEMATPDQARFNQRLFADAKRQADGLMTSKQIRDWRNRLGWSQAQAVALLGGGANAFSKYERGEVIQARSMDLLMRVLAQSPDARDVLQRIVSGELPDSCDVVLGSSEAQVRARRLELDWSPVQTRSTSEYKTVTRRSAGRLSEVRCANDDRYDWSAPKIASAF
ncbi:MAG: type II toxin-antitoxin system MqsA family antitoxin [Stenotrophomonas acidaminiphila]